jgi:hypothetical protein
MSTAKHILAVLATLLLSAGTSFAQVCDVSCAFTGVRTATPAEAQQHSGPAGHCHQQESKSAPQERPAPEPQKRDHSSDCQSHDYAVELVKSGKAAVTDASLNSAPVADLFRPLQPLLDRLIDGHARGRTSHSPPAPVVYSPLRI